jgi:hypothetical protein
MTIEEFAASDGNELRGTLLVLWWDAKGDWEKVHAVAQDVAGADGAWVHAYLHRKEGTWGMRILGTGAREEWVVAGDLKIEWEGIVGELLGR